MKLVGVLLLTLVWALVSPRNGREAIDTATDASKAHAAPAPQSMKAKYEGGVFGHSKTMEGTLNFDDTNNRLLFRNKKQKDVLFIPYQAVVSAFADTQKRRPAAATVAQPHPLHRLPVRLDQNESSLSDLAVSAIPTQTFRASPVFGWTIRTSWIRLSMRWQIRRD